MIQIKLLVYSFMLFLTLSFLASSNAQPLAGQEITNNTITEDDSFIPPPLIPDRIKTPSNIPSLEKRSDAVPATSVELEVFKKFAGVAATAYCRTVVPLDGWNCKKCKIYVPDGELVNTFMTFLTGATGFVLRSDKDKAIYLVFRGTNSIRQAINDLVFNLTSYGPVPNAKVHLGFSESFKAAQKLYFPDIQAQIAAYPDYKVIVTGHSLGGAQSLLAGLDLYQRIPKLNPGNLFIHTVGTPRIGDPTFAAYVESTGLTFTRSVNRYDIVPHLPPKAFGYLHAGVEIWTKSSSVIDVCDSDLESPNCSNTIAGSIKLNVFDHLTYYNINQGLCL